jgi:hypothetical protein
LYKLSAIFTNEITTVTRIKERHNIIKVPMTANKTQPRRRHKLSTHWLSSAGNELADIVPLTIIYSTVMFIEPSIAVKLGICE